MKIVLKHNKMGKRKLAIVKKGYLTKESYAHNLNFYLVSQKNEGSIDKLRLHITFFAPLKFFSFNFQTLNLYLLLGFLRFILLI